MLALLSVHANSGAWRLMLNLVTAFQEWRERGPHASTVERLTETTTDVLLPPVRTTTAAYWSPTCIPTSVLLLPIGFSDRYDVAVGSRFQYHNEYISNSGDYI